MLQLTASIIALTWEHDPCVGIRFRCGWPSVPFKSSKTEKPEIGANLNMHTMSGRRASPPLRRASEVISQSQLIQTIWEAAHISWCSKKKPLLFVIRRQNPRTALWSRCPGLQKLSASSARVELLTALNKIFISNYFFDCYNCFPLWIFPHPCSLNVFKQHFLTV